jgi:hypothetical protein
MRIEIMLFLATAAIMANVYTDGKFIKRALSYKKYYQMGGIALGALFLYYVIKKNPMNTRQILSTSNDYLKYMPLDRSTAAFVSPILDFTSKQDFFGSQGAHPYPILGFPNTGGGVGQGHGHGQGGSQGGSQEQRSTDRIIQSGKKSTKRSVSETKKKFVASRQNWKCGDCNSQLNAWFEVDHKIRLEYGGSNHIDNLVALCRECHGKKTTIENL